jgi:phosphate-transporting ATPase
MSPVPSADTGQTRDIETATPQLIVKDLHYAHLGPVSLTVARGECVALIGPSGAGKSLLLRAIVDLDPSNGQVALEGTPREAVPARDWRRRIAYVPAESGWWAETVRSHFPDPDAVVPLLQTLALPIDSLDWSVTRLSTGERQRLALARCLLRKPQVLLLDEPTSALDAKATTRVEAMLRDRMAAGAGIVLVTHDSDQADRLAHRVLGMRGGRIVALSEIHA